MKGKLIKTDNGYILEGNNLPNPRRLSLKNCETIENGYDLNDLSKDRFGNSSHHTNNRCSYKEGFQKALEILGDKKFSEEDLSKAILLSRSMEETFDTIVKSLQQTEWDVEIEMENTLENGYKNQPANTIGFVAEHKSVPKLDAEGCLILKRVE